MQNLEGVEVVEVHALDRLVKPNRHGPATLPDLFAGDINSTPHVGVWLHGREPAVRLLRSRLSPTFCHIPMAISPSDNPTRPLVARVIEPDPAIRGAIESLASTLPQRSEGFAAESGADDADPVPVAILGPGAPLDTIGSLREQGIASLVLARHDDSERIVEALRRRAGDVMRWPGDPEELYGRTHAAAARIRTAQALAVDRRDLRALLDLSEALTFTTDIDSTLHQIAARLAEVMHSERCSIVLLDDEVERGVVVADSSDASLENHPINVAEKYPEIVEVTKTRAPLVIDDVDKEPLFDDVRDIIADKPVGNTTIFPVLMHDRVQGVLLLRGADVRTEGLTERQIRFGEIISNATAIALRNARLHQSIRERTERVLSARIRAERRLKQIEKYQRFFDLAGDGLAIVDGRGQIVFANHAAQDILGFGPDDITQLRLRDLAAPNGTKVVEDLIAGFRQGRHRRRLDLPIVRSNGAPAILSLSTASLEPDGGRPARPDAKWADVAAIISMRDVTEPRRIQEELTKTKDFLENLIESTADAIVAADTNGNVLIFNPGAEAITGYSYDQAMTELHVASLYPRGVAREIMRRLLSKKHGGVGKYETGRHEMVTKAGERIPINISASLIYADGKVIASVGIFSDLRERIRMEEELANANKQLEISERQAGALEVAGTAAHELSQPLTTIMGSAELMIRRLPNGDANRRSSERILAECERMAGIVQKIGQITKYETKPYLGHTNILDLDAATKDEE